jgi:hypothetical protein
MLACLFPGFGCVEHQVKFAAVVVVDENREIDKARHLLDDHEAEAFRGCITIGFGMRGSRIVEPFADFRVDTLAGVGYDQVYRIILRVRKNADLAVAGIFARIVDQVMNHDRQ